MYIRPFHILCKIEQHSLSYFNKCLVWWYISQFIRCLINNKQFIRLTIFSRINSNPLLISAQKQMLLVEEVDICHHHNYRCENCANFDHISVVLVLFQNTILILFIIAVITLILVQVKKKKKEVKVGEDTPDWQSVSNIHNEYNENHDNDGHADLWRYTRVTKGFVSLLWWHQKWLSYAACHHIKIVMMTATTGIWKAYSWHRMTWGFWNFPRRFTSCGTPKEIGWLYNIWWLWLPELRYCHQGVFSKDIFQKFLLNLTIRRKESLVVAQLKHCHQ